MSPEERLRGRTAGTEEGSGSADTTTVGISCAPPPEEIFKEDSRIRLPLYRVESAPRVNAAADGSLHCT
jgi:hypothetical protein